MTPRQHSRQTPRRRSQQGFVTSTAQVALAIVALALSATVGSLDSARQEAAEQVAHVQASLLMKVGADLQLTLDRAVTDGGLARTSASGVLRVDGVAGDAGRIDLFDPQLGYGRRPQWPVGMVVEDVEGAGQLRWADVAGQVLEVTGIDAAVCRRFNEMLQGTDLLAAPPIDLDIARRERGWTQGCWAAEGAAYGTWFMEAFAGTHCRGAGCRSGDVVGAAVRRLAEVQSDAPLAGTGAAAADGVMPLDPMSALAACAAREAAAGARDPQAVAERCAKGA